MSGEHFSLTGHLPVVEYRSKLDRYFITYPELQVELAPAFTHKLTAHEVACHSYHGTPYFTHIPKVPYGTAYPRPGMVMPKIHPVDIKLRIA